MKKIIIFLVLVAIVVAGYYYVNNNNESTIESKSKFSVSGDVSITPISHATMVLKWGDEVIYNDPVGDAEAFAGMKEANIILISDTHGDHLNLDTLQAVVSANSVIIVPQAVADELPSDLSDKTVVLSNGATTSQRGFTIEAVPMYNLPESDENFHTKGRGNGYLIEKDGTRVYIAGDTADIPEMRSLTDIDIAFIPMNLPYTMDVETAASAVLEFKPKQVYPYHYRGQDGFSDVNKFKEIVNAGDSNIEVVLLDWYPEEEVANLDSGEEADVVFNVSGKNFEFDVKEIRVKEGDSVTINFESTDGFHDWVVDEFDAATARVQTGGTTSVTFVADKKGTFEYYCSVGQHRANGMVGQLIVE